MFHEIPVRAIRLAVERGSRLGREGGQARLADSWDPGFARPDPDEDLRRRVREYTQRASHGSRPPCQEEE